MINIFNKLHRMDMDWCDEAGVFRNTDDHDYYQNFQVKIYNFLRTEYLKKFGKFDFKR